MNTVKLGFELRVVRLTLTDILATKLLKEPQRNNKTFRMIKASIKEVGLIEPLVVREQKGQRGKYFLLEGHLRQMALKELGQTEADCIIATDDECYTYNAKVNRLNPIAQHKMIMRAVDNGVKAERIAIALNIPISEVKSSMALLDGVNSEAADLLKDKQISPKAIRLLRKVSGVRQIEIAEMMTSSNNFTTGYAEAMVLSTPVDQCVGAKEPKKKVGMTREEIAKLEVEMEALERDLKAVEQGYGENMLNLTLAKGYIKRLVENAAVVRFLRVNYPDILAEFQGVASAESV